MYVCPHYEDTQHAYEPSSDLIFITGSAILSISIGLNAVSSHGTCTAIFVAVAAVVGFILSSIRTLGRISWLAWLGLASILTASTCLVVFL